MGCFSSKLLKQSGKLYERLNKRSQRRPNGLQGPPMSINGGKKLLRPLSYTRNTEAKTVTLYEEPGTQSNADVEHTDFKLIDIRKHKIDSKQSLELAKAEIINVWELLAGLEEEAEIEGYQKAQTGKGSRVHTTEPTYHKFTVSAKDYKSTSEKKEGRVVHTVEDYEAFLASHNLQEEKENAVENAKSRMVRIPQECVRVALEEEEQGNNSEEEEEEEHAELNSQHSNKCQEAEVNKSLFDSDEMDSKRRTEERYLSAIESPSSNFSRSGSLKEWLPGGGQTISAEQTESCSTFFYPEMVAQFEQSMEQLMMDESFILQQILERFDEDHGKVIAENLIA